MKAILRKLPKREKEVVKASWMRLKSLAKVVIYYGNARFCPICEKSSRQFRSAGAVLREDVRCAHCGSLERHRLLWLYLSARTDLFDGKPKKLLHVAPEPCFEPILRQHFGDSYITADLLNPTVSVKMDITSIQYPDQSFDVIYCSHVLEHVQDDKKAMREFYRTLKNSGWAILLVPITAAETFEDPSITEPEERLKAFGQEDHVRIYGPDYADRLRGAGFKVEVSNVGDFASEDEIRKMRLSGEIYFCTK